MITDHEFTGDDRRCVYVGTDERDCFALPEEHADTESFNAGVEAALAVIRSASTFGPGRRAHLTNAQAFKRDLLPAVEGLLR